MLAHKWIGAGTFCAGFLSIGQHFAGPRHPVSTPPMACVVRERTAIGRSYHEPSVGWIIIVRQFPCATTANT